MMWKVPYFDLRLGDEEKEAVLKVLDSNWLTTGPMIVEFEKAFARALQVPEERAVALSNCTVALHLALVTLGIGEGDEVICPSLTFVASCNAIRYTGAIPVFVDIRSEDDWTLDPVDVAKKITPRTRAIVAVHYGGYACDMDALGALASQHDLRIVEDAAHAPLATFDGRKLGAIGDIGCFSFFSNKNMTTGEGGMLVARESDVAARARLLRSHGLTTSTFERFQGHAFGYDVADLGYNYRMDEIRAALGLVQLQKLPGANHRRGKIVRHYRQALKSELPKIKSPFRDHPGESAYHVFPVLLPEEGPTRETVMEDLKQKGIQTSIHFRPVHGLTAYQQYDASVPVTDSIAPRILSLPLFPELEKEQILFVVNSLGQCLAK